MMQLMQVSNASSGVEDWSHELLFWPIEGRIYIMGLGEGGFARVGPGTSFLVWLLLSGSRISTTFLSSLLGDAPAKACHILSPTTCR